MKDQGVLANRNRAARKRPLPGFVAGLTLLATVGATAANVPADLVTAGGNDMSSGFGDSSAPIVTPDGRFVAFVSGAGNLVTNDYNGTTDVFLRDRGLGRTLLVSVNAAGTGSANSASASPSVSSNGQFVVFQSRANNLASRATNGWENLFVRDMVSGTTALVSAGTNGVAGDYSSLSPEITPDGRFIVFESLADNLVGDDNNRLSDVFVRDLAGSNTVLVSVNASGSGTGSGYSINPSIAPNGRFVVFESTVAGLVTNDFNTSSDVFLRDLIAGSTTLISVGVNGTAAGNSRNAVLSDDGRYVAFESTASTLVAGDSDTLNDIFLRDLQSGTTRLVSTRSDFNLSSNAPNRPVISRDGRSAAFQTGAAPLSSVVTIGQIYLWVAQSGSNVLVSVSLDRITPAGGVSHSPVISGDNRYVTFQSNATNLVAGTTNGMFQVYQRDPVAGDTTLVSVNSSGNGNNLDCSAVAASDNGRVVAFESRDDNLVADDGNFAYDVFLRNLTDNTTELISKSAVGLASATSRGPSSLVPGALSADGRYAVFGSVAPNLVPNDANAVSDVFVRDLWNGTNALVSVSTNGTGGGDGASWNPVISADGRFVAFASQATNLTSGVTNRKGNIFLRDLHSGTTTLVSANASGQGGNGASINPSINADGRRITYESLASDLVLNDLLNNASDIFQYDRSLGTNMRVSIGMNGQSGSAASRSPIITSDGRFVIFLSDAKNLVTTITFGPSQLFARDMVNNETFLVSVDSTTVRNQIGPASHVLSRDGRFLAYTATTNAYVFDLVARTNTLIFSGGFNASISGNGRFIAFEKPLYANGGSLTNSAVVVWDRELGAEVLASANAENTGSGNAYSRSPVFGADGRFVVFKSQASDLGGSDTNGVTDVFVRDLVLGQTLMISLNRSGTASGNRLSGNPILGSDGRTVLFESFASDLAANDFNEAKDIFVLRLSAVDSDNDAMDDDWEMAYLETLSRDGAGDFDGDGLSDLAEFKSGTNPKNDNSILRALTVASLSDGSTTVYWSAIPGRTYQVQFKDSADDSTWNSLHGTVLAADTTASKADSAAAGSFKRFYRVELISP